MIWKVSGRSKTCPDLLENVAGLSKILQNAFVADLKIDAIYALYRESFCDKNLAIRKVFAFCDSDCILSHEFFSGVDDSWERFSGFLSILWLPRQQQYEINVLRMISS